MWVLSTQKSNALLCDLHRLRGFVNDTMKHFNQNLLALKAYVPGRPIEDVAREIGVEPESVVKLASNENPLGVSPKALKAIKASVDEMFIYPDGAGLTLRHAIARRYNVELENVTLGNGSNEILELLGHGFLNPQSSLVYSAHSFASYEIIGMLFGAERLEIPMTKGLAHDLDAMADAIRPDTSMVIVCNPNNPTGTLLDQAALDRFMARVPEDVLVVFDEAYAELCQGEMPDTMKYIREGRFCAVLRTFSKAYGLAGLRIGYSISPKCVGAALERIRQAFNTNRLAQIAAVAALEDDEFVQNVRVVLAEGKAYLESECTRLGLEFIPTYTNFLLIRVGDSVAVFNALIKKGVIARAQKGAGLPEWIRVTIGRPEQNRAFIQALSEVMNLK